MLVHICCAVDSHYFLKKLQKEFPKERLIGFFYDPNIHPYSEYYLRLLEVQRSCDMLGIELIEGEYDVKEWLQSVRGLEHEPEKGKRCNLCFDRRFEVSAKKAKELGENSFTSTLLTSPKKSLKQLKASGDALGKLYGIEFIAPNYRKASGTQEQNILAKQDQLYRQDYCGCLYALNTQRGQQNRLTDELFTPLSAQIQPESIESRIQLYKKRLKLESQNSNYRITKERFLNWRIKYGKVTVKQKTLVSHFLPYSTMKKPFTRGRIEYQLGQLYYFSRDEVKFITLSHYNQLANSQYQKITELIFNPPSFEKELNVRNLLISGAYDTSTIIVVNEIPLQKLEIYLQSHIYEDVKEVLIEI